MKDKVLCRNTYETDELISQYLEFHYGDEYFGIPNFPKTCVDLIIEQFKGMRLKRSLDLGCAVGRSSLELATHCDHVDAIDFSYGFIEHAKKIVEQGDIAFSIVNEGELRKNKTVSLESLGLTKTAKSISFSQADAGNLAPSYTDYDLVFAGNLIDRLREPKAFLESIHERINHEGLLVLTSPYTWLEEFTPKENWLGGYEKEGVEITTLEGLTESLSGHFETFTAPIDVPFVIRETARKHQHTVAQMTFWRRKSE